MDETSSKSLMMDSPTLDEADIIVQETRDLFNRTLANWASDVLALQRSGLDTPCWNTSHPPDQWSIAA